MEHAQPRDTIAAPISALALAAGAALLFGVGDAVGFLSDAAEDVFIATWLLGWVLLAWAVIISGGYAVVLGMRLSSKRSVSPWGVAVLSAAVALIAVVVATHPLWGSGSGTGG